MKKLVAIVLVVVLSMIGLGGMGLAEGNKVAFITAYALGNDFIDMICDGIAELEEEGWESIVIEALDVAEYEESLRAAAADGFNVIEIFGAELISVACDLSDEFAELYPDLHIFALDTSEDYGCANITSVSIDPFQSSFVAGYVAAMTSETGTVGIIMHHDTPTMLRFSMGYYAGIEYADNGTTVYTSITGDATDVTLANEAAKTMISNYPEIDTIYQVCYTAGTGVITACADAGIRCIGVDDWQGYIDPCVFWSALKPINVASAGVARLYAQGEELPARLDYNIQNGCKVYDERDLENLPEEIQTDVLALVQGIEDNSIDVYENYEDARIDY